MLESVFGLFNGRVIKKSKGLKDLKEIKSWQEYKEGRTSRERERVSKMRR